MSPHWTLFSGGYATPLFHGQWLDLGGTGIPHAMKLVDAEGMATPEFKRLWQAQFPTKEQLPDHPATPDGKPTLRFIEVFR